MRGLLKALDYGIGNPFFFKEKTITIKKSQIYQRKSLLNNLIEGLYKRSKETQIKRGEFKVIGDIIIIHPSNHDFYYKVHFWGDQVDEIEQINTTTKSTVKLNSINVCSLKYDFSQAE